MTEKKQYEQVCKDRFDEIIEEIRDLKNRLFIDNSNECLQSKVNRHNRWIKAVAGFLTIVGCGLFGVICWVLKIWLSKSI